MTTTTDQPAHPGLDVLVSTPEQRQTRARELTMAMQCAALADRHLDRARVELARGDVDLVLAELQTVIKWSALSAEHARRVAS